MEGRGGGFPPMGPGTGTVTLRLTDLPGAAGAGRGGVGWGLLREPCCRAGLGVPDLCWLPVPGTRRPVDAKFLAGLAPGQQFE